MIRKSSVPFALQSMLLWSCMPILFTFLPIYLAQKNLDASRIGIIMALNPFMALFLQPLFGQIADRSRSKNRLFSFLMGGTVLSILLLPLIGSFAYIVTVVAVLSVAQISTIPISESISLESLDRIDKPYGPVRMMGTAGFSLASILLGYTMEWKLNSLFIITAFLGFLSIIFTEKLPHVEGHQSTEARIPFWEVFRDDHLKVFVPLSVIAQLSVSFYMTYLPMYFISIGGDRARIGWIYFIMGAGEVIVLFFADRLIAWLGIRRALGLSICVMGLRFIALLIIRQPAWMYLISAFNGFTFIIFGFGLAVYVNRTVKNELRTTGQSILALAAALGRVIGALAGGFLISAFGLNHSQGFAAILCISTLIVYFAALRIIGKPLPENTGSDPVEILDRVMNTESFE